MGRNFKAYEFVMNKIFSKFWALVSTLINLVLFLNLVTERFLYVGTIKEITWGGGWKAKIGGSDNKLSNQERIYFLEYLWWNIFVRIYLLEYIHLHQTNICLKTKDICPNDKAENAEVFDWKVMTGMGDRTKNYIISTKYLADQRYLTDIKYMDWESDMNRKFLWIWNKILLGGLQIGPKIHSVSFHSLVVLYQADTIKINSWFVHGISRGVFFVLRILYLAEVEGGVQP